MWSDWDGQKGLEQVERSQMSMARLMDIPVMLSPFVALRVNSAKQPSAQRDRPFDAAQGDKQGPSIGIKFRNEERQEAGW